MAGMVGNVRDRIRYRNAIRAKQIRRLGAGEGADDGIGLQGFLRTFGAGTDHIARDQADPPPAPHGFEMGDARVAPNLNPLGQGCA